MSCPEDLAASLSAVTAKEYVRFVADWLPRASQLTEEPSLTFIPVVDALVGAAAEYAACIRHLPVPAWTQGPKRFLGEVWWGSRIIPGHADRVLLLRLPRYTLPHRWRGRYARAWLYRYCLAATPLSFRRHGLVIENDSLVSV